VTTVGGQAVLEGVMMRGASTWAVAVRRPDASIDVRTFPLSCGLARHRVQRLPVVRGAVALFASLGIGLRAMRISTDVALGEVDQPVSRGTWAGTVVAGLALAVGLFFLLPAALTSLSGVGAGSGVAFVVAEKLVRLTVFLVYLGLVSRLPHLQRVFAYHGAEHKVISCFEAGLPLTPERAQRFSRLHPRCGTSFLLVVMVVAIVVFAPLGSPSWPVLIASRVIGIPLIAGLAFEAIRWLARHPARRSVRVLMWPGLQLQRLTTREPDLSQLAVAIAALDAVLAAEAAGDAGEAERAGLEAAA